MGVSAVCMLWTGTSSAPFASRVCSSTSNECANSSSLYILSLSLPLSLSRSLTIGILQGFNNLAGQRSGDMGSGSWSNGWCRAKWAPMGDGGPGQVSSALSESSGYPIGGQSGGAACFSLCIAGPNKEEIEQKEAEEKASEEATAAALVEFRAALSVLDGVGTVGVAGEGGEGGGRAVVGVVGEATKGGDLAAALGRAAELVPVVKASLEAGTRGEIVGMAKRAKEVRARRKESSSNSTSRELW